MVMLLHQDLSGMKNLTFATVLIAFVFFTGCKKSIEPQPAPEPGNLYLHIHTFSNTTEFLPGDTVTDASGRKYKYDVAQSYISGISLIRMDGTAIPVNNVNLFIEPGVEDYLIGSVPAGNYRTVAFDIGIGASQNHLDPMMYAASDALAPKIPSMHFASNSEGYMFLHIAGTMDTTTSMNGPLDQPFSYQVGIDSLLRHQIISDHPFSILPGQTAYFHIYADYARLFQGINIRTENTGAGGDAVAQKIANNIPDVFFY
jgi:hypothetical protein